MRITHFSLPAAARLALLIGAAAALAASAGADPLPAGSIELSLSPRVCTLTVRDRQCETQVHAQWRAPQPESLCLLILGRPEIKRCWEQEQAGAYSIDLVFADDLTFELRETDLQHILATETLRVIREAVNYRHKRRQPWSIFD